MRQFVKVLALGLLLSATVTGCVRNGAIQPDRTVFNLDGNYQRHVYETAIEETFDRTVVVFREAGYKLDVVDRATGQISGQRGPTGTQKMSSDTGLKFYALVLPNLDNDSVLALKIVQVVNQGVPVISQSKTELIVTQPEMYQYLFKRIAGFPVTGQMPNAGAELPAAQ